MCNFCTFFDPSPRGSDGAGRGAGEAPPVRPGGGRGPPTPLPSSSPRESGPAPGAPPGAPRGRRPPPAGAPQGPRLPVGPGGVPPGGTPLGEKIPPVVVRGRRASPSGPDCVVGRPSRHASCRPTNPPVLERQLRHVSTSGIYFPTGCHASTCNTVTHARHLLALRA